MSEEERERVSEEERERDLRRMGRRVFCFQVSTSYIGRVGGTGWEKLPFRERRAQQQTKKALKVSKKKTEGQRTKEA